MQVVICVLLTLLFIVIVKSQINTVEYVPYTDNGFALAGYLAQPTTGPGPFPAVIIIPDFDGVGQYEAKRARMIADQGYIGFAADIYGANKHNVTDSTERSQLLSLYRGNTTLFVSRIQAAVDLLRNSGRVIPEKIAMMGYCFGGTGVINYALSGGNVSGIVSFHGGLTQRVTAKASVPILARMLLYSGGSDDPTTEIKKLEAELNQTQAVWEITRLSQIRHGFTIWGGSGYNARADIRSWEGALLFFTELFNPSDPNVIPALPIPSGSPPQETPVNYSDNGFSLTGYEVLPNNDNTKLPAVIILPDWDGVNYYEINRARLTATHTDPYVTFAADIFGSDKHNVTDITERSNLTNMYRNNITLYNSRIKAAVTAVKSRPRVDPSKIAIMGYCFGGTGVFDYSISGANDILGVISFHGGLTNRLTASAATPIRATILVHSGGADDTSTSIEQLENELNSASATWEMSRYSNVVHGFTDWNAGSAYSPRADMRSRKSMITYLKVLFSGGVYSGSVQPSDITLPTSPPTTTPTPTPIIITPSSTPTPSQLIISPTPTQTPTQSPTQSPAQSPISTSSDITTSIISTTSTQATSAASTTATPTSTTETSTTTVITTPTTATTTSNENPSNLTTTPNSTSIAIIVGAVIGVLALVAVIVIVIAVAKRSEANERTERLL